jgi:hypothetical protein
MFLCVNFHFFMGDGLIPWFDPTRPFDEGVSLDTLMPLFSVIIFIVNARLLVVMTGIPVSQDLSRGLHRLRGFFGAGRRATPQVADGASSGV